MEKGAVNKFGARYARRPLTSHTCPCPNLPQRLSSPAKDMLPELLKFDQIPFFTSPASNATAPSVTIQPPATSMPMLTSARQSRSPEFSKKLRKYDNPLQRARHVLHGTTDCPRQAAALPLPLRFSAQPLTSCIDPETSVISDILTRLASLPDGAFLDAIAVVFWVQ
jgi:hypothetical protein